MSTPTTEAGEARTTAFVSAQWLERHLTDPRVAVIEITDDPAHVDAPGTIPGGRAVYWKNLLWHAERREFASAAELSDRLLALGAGTGHTLVFAGEPTQFAAYALWVARVVGVGGDLRYLDGGLEAWRWRDSGSPDTPVEAQFIRPYSALPVSTPQPEHVIDRDGVRQALDSDTVVVDLRSPEEFAGDRVSPATEPIDHGAQRHGRIPGARSLHVRELLDDVGRVLPADALRERISTLDAEQAPELVFYCRLSHRAALGWLVFTDILDDPRVRVYDGSWTEWGSIVGTPIER
ncbi:rhodanese-like domain-containing protein [Gordonia sp. ABSL11-1]|uniref:sulfurtransferase n=1 Tax=Gordonia sp. ABSL11-1 TaxID=3053924 RepID=UPI002573D638|nr:rhodanese-like domain-containing protein [Gordonia sp. ABSL11-1]MDL9947935.1 rhodanese-like domain-containing protein [Gordonia sp. ABSL11-1]